MAEYIEKNKIINLLEHNDKVYHYADRDKENIVHDTVQTLCRVIIEAEAADVQPMKRGKWIENAGYGGWGDTIYQCSECGSEWTCETGISIDWYFCPNCGARMDE